MELNKALHSQKLLLLKFNFKGIYSTLKISSGTILGALSRKEATMLPLKLCHATGQRTPQDNTSLLSKWWEYVNNRSVQLFRLIIIIINKSSNYIAINIWLLCSTHFINTCNWSPLHSSISTQLLQHDSPNVSILNQVSKQPMQGGGGGR